jgi:hypothetical protein
MAMSIGGLCAADHVTREDWLAALELVQQDGLSREQFQHGVVIGGKAYTVKRMRLHLEKVVRRGLGLPEVTVKDFTGGEESVRFVRRCWEQCSEEGDPHFDVGQVADLRKHKKKVDGE